MAIRPTIFDLDPINTFLKQMGTENAHCVTLIKLFPPSSLTHLKCIFLCYIIMLSQKKHILDTNNLPLTLEDLCHYCFLLKA